MRPRDRATAETTPRVGLGDVTVGTDKDAYSPGEAVVVKAYLRPDVYCFCLEHEWAVRVVRAKTCEVVREWRWAARSGERGYRGRTLEWVASESGVYRIAATLSTHGSTASKTITIGEG